MIQNLFALVLLILTISPFTAPFQSFTDPRTDAVALGHADDPGCLVAPPVTKVGRLSVVLPPGLIKASFVLIALPMPVRASSNLASPDSTRLTVLRL